MMIEKVLKSIYCKIITASALVLLSFSCSSRQDINIDSSGRGSCTVRIDLDSFFTEYLRDLSDAAGSLEGDFYVFDRQEIEESFRKHSDAELTDVRIRGSGSIELDISFSNPEEILRENAINPVIEYSRKDGISILSFNLNTENYQALSRMTGLADNPVLAALTPQPDNPYTNDEYLDMIDFVFSDYEGGDRAAMTVSKAEMEINIETSGEVLRAENGKAYGSRAVFRVPLLRFLTLSSPVEFSVSYR